MNIYIRHMTAPALTRRPHRTADMVAPAPEMALARGRLHELCGPARRSGALWLAGAMTGPVLWITPARMGERLSPCGMAGWADPGRFLFAAPRRDEDVLWCMEEALRSGVVPLVVADGTGPPGLTPVRRLHLAAESSGTMPLGVILTPGDGGAPGVESRWHVAPAHGESALGWRLERRRARTLPPRAWVMQETDGRRRLTPAPPPDG
jgi:protein ImuA